MTDYTIPEAGIEFPPPPAGLCWDAALHVTGDIRVGLLNDSCEERYWALVDSNSFRTNPKAALEGVLNKYQQKIEDDAHKAAFDQALRDAAVAANKARTVPR
ncbi:hypothetical protein [Aeromicrobium sp. 179-A 4D2 NHS]|uniref:hypothetical protein n=1 Tax=Aeromicrobium sp. 179-A 4D2 NHS TaxID=3142375 RepID=UPI00399F926C